MTTAHHGAEITLSGPPHNMSVVLRLVSSRTAVVPISISVGGEATIYRGVVRPVGKDASEIRLRLPSDTPPGIYSGEGTIAGEPRGIMLQVERVMKLRVQPKRTMVTAAASSSVEFALTVVNGGNVAFEVPESDVFDLDVAGQNRALGRTLRATLSEGERRVDRLFEELRENHGGEARVAVKSGAGRLEPGESRELTCLLDVPAMAQEGRTYSGAWRLGNNAHVIVAEILKSARHNNGRTNGRTKG